MNWILALALVTPLAAAPARVVILTGQSDTQYHDWRATTPFVERTLDAAGGFEVRVVEEIHGITRDTLAGFDAAIVNYNGPRWGASAEAALEEFVRSGKGLVSFHGVTYGPLCGTTQAVAPARGWLRTPPWQGWLDMLAATWAPEHIGHAPRGSFTIKPGNDPIVRGLPAEFTVNDELYHRISLALGARVIATAFDDPSRGGTGKDEPMAWTNPYGKGRVFHTPLGHDVNALYHPAVMALLARGTEWAATGNVTLPPRVHLNQAAKEAPRVLVVTGGHGYSPSFYTVFESMPDIRWTHAASQKEAFAKPLVGRVDVVVLYDLGNDLAEGERANLRAFVEAGKGVVALHHSIVDYTNWPWWWQEVIGGKYFEKPLENHEASKYKEGVEVVTRIAKGQERHPIVRGVGDIVTEDEVYRGMWHAPGITVLMETQHELNDRPVVYIGPRRGARAVYIQLGHGEYTHRHPGYRTLVHNAILWAAGR